jgi:hypothetical protein
MKTLTSFLIALVATVFFACNVPNITTQLKDDTQRKTIISDLLVNDNYTTELMDAMMASDHTKKMMMSDDHMMKMMKDTAMHSRMMNHMMTMMEKDTTMCKNMCSKMMDNPKMKSMMEGMMKHHGMKHDREMDMKAGEKMKKK